MRQCCLDRRCLRLTPALLWPACLLLSGQAVAARASRLGSELGSSRQMAAGLLSTALPSTPTGGQAAVSQSGYYAADVVTVISWLRADAANPMIVFVAGYGDCDAPDPEFGTVCKPWLERSADGGSRWTQLRPTTSFDPDLSQNSRFAAIKSSTDGHHLYMGISSGVSPDSYYSSLLTSNDGGLTWQEAGDIALPVVSPLSSARAYCVSGASEEPSNGCCMGLSYSTDGGTKWHPMTLPAGLQQAVGTLVADARRLNTAYFNANSASYLGSDAPPAPTVVFRTDDLGAQWTTVMTPTATPLLGSFFVSTDPNSA